MAALALVTPATAADLHLVEPTLTITEPGGFEARWQVSAEVYLWTLGLDGTIGNGDVRVDLDAGFSEIWNDLNSAFMGVAEARYDRFGIFGDLVYADLSASGSGPLRGIIRASGDFQLTLATLMGAFRVVENRVASVDLMAGARVYGVDAEIDVAVGPIGLSRGAEEVWVDPLIGAKGRLQGTSPLYLTAWGMVGGFGVSSDIAWDAFAGLGYEVSDRFSVFGGYRGLGVDYSNPDFLFDIIFHGPIFGGVFRF